MRENLITVRELFNKLAKNELKDGTTVNLYGWVRTNRGNNSIGFVEFNDGTNFRNLQLVYEANKVKDFNALSHIQTGESIFVQGKIVLTPEGKQPFEINVNSIEVVGECDPDYPLQKKRHTFEFLREIAHLRPRANTFNAVYKVRNVLTMAVHNYFQEQGFMYVHTPIITTNDGEGAGEVFK